MYHHIVILLLIQAATCEEVKPKLESICPSCHSSPLCAEMYEIFPGHTACLPPHPKTTPVELTDKEKQDIVDYHNELRANIKPIAADMSKMYWDNETEMMAKRWADACLRTDTGDLLHDTMRFTPGRVTYGQNLAMGHKDIRAAIYGWYSEKENYDPYFNKNIPNDIKPVLHYTQVVWAYTPLLGCGISRCPDGVTYVCNYGPSGNMWPFLTPYKPAKSMPGEDCPNTRTKDGLCDCGPGFLCQRGATPFVNNCTCKCFWGGVGNMCQNDCIKDQWYCGGFDGFRTKDCKGGGLHYICPALCGYCPCTKMNYTSVKCQAAVMLSSYSLYLITYILINSIVFYFSHM